MLQPTLERVDGLEADGAGRRQGVPKIDDVVGEVVSAIDMFTMGETSGFRDIIIITEGSQP